MMAVKMVKRPPVAVTLPGVSAAGAFLTGELLGWPLAWASRATDLLSMGGPAAPVRRLSQTRDFHQTPGFRQKSCVNLERQWC